MTQQKNSGQNVAGAYADKLEHYFTGVRRDIVERLPHNTNGRILEIGCGTGGTGALALAEGRCSEYYAIELDGASAAVASQHITAVVEGDIETMPFPWVDKKFDALILSEVLEHLRDPWAVIRELSTMLRPGAVIFASSPNVAHYRIILMQMRGEWKLTSFGPMDETHLRWFTPASYQRMFEDCGYKVLSVQPANNLSRKAKIATLIPGVGWWLFSTQFLLEARA